LDHFFRRGPRKAYGKRLKDLTRCRRYLVLQAVSAAKLPQAFGDLLRNGRKRVLVQHLGNDFCVGRAQKKSWSQQVGVALRAFTDFDQQCHFLFWDPARQFFEIRGCKQQAEVGIIKRDRLCQFRDCPASICMFGSSSCFEDGSAAEDSDVPYP
jgi:hypothetical protein